MEGSAIFPYRTQPGPVRAGDIRESGVRPSGDLPELANSLRSLLHFPTISRQIRMLLVGLFYLHRLGARAGRGVSQRPLPELVTFPFGFSDYVVVKSFSSHLHRS